MFSEIKIWPVTKNIWITLKKETVKEIRERNSLFRENDGFEFQYVVFEMHMKT